MLVGDLDLHKIRLTFHLFLNEDKNISTNENGQKGKEMLRGMNYLHWYHADINLVHAADLMIKVSVQMGRYDSDVLNYKSGKRENQQVPCDSRMRNC